MAIKVFAPAKVNLTLHVTGQREDGYHLLDSLVVFPRLGDWVSVDEGRGPGLSLTMSGPMVEGVPCDERNSILKAARFLGQDLLAFRLQKNLPAAAGIGGGTSDAAAALRAVAQLRGLPLPAPRDVVGLGADVPVSLYGQPARMRGVGEVIDPIPPLPEYMGMVLINPRVSVPTPAIFKRLTRKDNPPMPDRIPAFDTAQALADWLAGQRNDLEAPAIAEAPVIAEVLKVLRAEKPLIARMSGSGATCFALYATEYEAKAVGGMLADQHPHWWVHYAGLSAVHQLIRATT